MIIKITTSDGIEHPVPAKPDGSPDFEGYAPNSMATRDALQSAYAAGNWEHYTPPEPEPEQPEPNWQDFRLALLESATFRDWSERLPATWREDLKLAAIAANSEALQSIYDHCKSLSMPVLSSVSGWQQIANENYIPVTF
ncbi:MULTISPECIES: hypothetical protein [Cyanophyceae]|uniref:hypothetical protein n=1 Tax=Cyanophyceae TaxID=3028117 RepID=UPI001688B6B3|nr:MULTISPECIES: hypothetical protein [Cyanophyceae]MBD1917171.1 hypothetical protein [Phormidium sp. FACHB-77]MBD2030702.1 hypothetical protein [Phormidium sp. FACHB-322]MBD2050190.1 hypothetical protein [Leptolyngbya sp. FACHB-60]